MKINTIPEGFTYHTDDSSKFGYPVGVDHNTRLHCILKHKEELFLYENMQAQSFGWNIAAAIPCCVGLSSVEAPIVAYKVL